MQINHIKIIFFITIFLFSQTGYSQRSNETKISQRFYIESIKVEGNTKSKTGAVLDNLAFVIGDSLSEDEIHQHLDDLRNLEMFKEIELSPRAGSVPGRLHLIIRVKERYWPVCRFKGGFSELDSWYITPIGIHFDNIFGYGNFINTDFTIGDRLSSIKCSYINPNIFDSDFDFHLRLYVQTRQYLHYLNSLITQIEIILYRECGSPVSIFAVIFNIIREIIVLFIFAGINCK